MEHHETLKHLPLDVTTSALDAAISVLDATTSALDVAIPELSAISAIAIEFLAIPAIVVV